MELQGTAQAADLQAEEARYAALRAANAKFTRRFEGVEAELAAIGKMPSDSNLAEMDALWDTVKAQEKAAKVIE